MNLLVMFLNPEAVTVLLLVLRVMLRLFHVPEVHAVALQEYMLMLPSLVIVWAIEV